jgi:hypothetical protein
MCTHILGKYYEDDQKKENDMNGVCITHGRDKKFIKIITSEYLKGRGHLEDLNLDGNTVLKRICWGLDSIVPIRDRVQWGLF